MMESTPLISNNEATNKCRQHITYARIFGVFIVVLIAIFVFFLLPQKASSKSEINLTIMSTLDQTSPPFSHFQHKIKPQLINSALKAPFPTNEWWTNLLISDSHGNNTGAGPITSLPYTYKSTSNGLEISYGGNRIKVNESIIIEEFYPDVTISLSSDRLSREVIAYDTLSVTVDFKSIENQSFKAYLVRGSPYTTIELKNSIPSLLFGEEIESFHCTSSPINKDQSTITANSSRPIKNKTRNNPPIKNEEKILTTQCTVHTINNQLWKIYATNLTSFKLENNSKIVGLFPSTGVLRVAYLPQDISSVESILDQHCDTYPIGGKVKFNVTQDIGKVSFIWKTQGGNPKNLLMTALPHHIDSFNNKKNPRLYHKLNYKSVKGLMKGILGDIWHIKESLTLLSFDAPRLPINSTYIKEIINSLYEDSEVLPIKTDPYFFGKEIARQARLILIANQMDQLKLRDKIIKNVSTLLTPWMKGLNSDRFVYDTIWGGICSKNGLDGIFWMTDFGNGWYNDHHFHYGYFLYTAAVLCRFDSSFCKTHFHSLLALVRDIANPSQEDKDFPFTRYFSWFDGHSWASGVFTLEEGKSQESISESINAYYSIYLLGKSMNIKNLEQLGRLLLAMEMRAAHTYWQMPSWKTIYPQVFAKNKMIGQLASTQVKYSTCFGSEVEDMHLINIIPFTPITEELIEKVYVQEQFPVLLENALKRKKPLITEGWKGYSYLNFAVLNPLEAWEKLLNLTEYDDGNSRTNSLFWIATRP